MPSHRSIRGKAIFIFGSKLAVVDGTGEGDHVTDVGYTGEIHDATLEAQTEACMASRAVLPQIHNVGLTLFVPYDSIKIPLTGRS